MFNEVNMENVPCCRGDKQTHFNESKLMSGPLLVTIVFVLPFTNVFL